MPADLVANVDPTSIANELANGSLPYLKLAEGNYPSLNITRQVALVGAHSTNHGQPDPNNTTLSHVVIKGGKGILYDLNIDGTQAGTPLVKCSDIGMFQTRLSRFRNLTGAGFDGVDTNSCVLVDVVQSYFNTAWESIKIAGPNDYRVVQNYIVRSGSDLNHTNSVYIGSDAIGTFFANTLYMSGTISCIQGQGVSSVIMVQSMPLNGCTADPAEVVTTADEQSFVEQPANVLHPAASLYTQIVDKLGTSFDGEDFYGNPRTQGSFTDLGAEEVQ